MTWIQMYPSGHIVHYDMFTPSDIYIEDIAHHLAFECRYGGGVRKHYSVAEHSVNVSKNVPWEYAREALLHDASEAYMKDITNGLKNMPGMAWYRQLEQRFQEVIYERYNIVSTPESREIIKKVDSAITLDESIELTADSRPYASRRENIAPLKIQISGYKNTDAESLFLYRFRQLFNVQ